MIKSHCTLYNISFTTHTKTSQRTLSTVHFTQPYSDGDMPHLAPILHPIDEQRLDNYEQLISKVQLNAFIINSYILLAFCTFINVASIYFNAGLCCCCWL